MPISPNEIVEDETWIRESLIYLIDKQLSKNNLCFEVPQNLDNENVIKHVVEIYNFVGWTVKWYPFKRILRQRDMKAKIMTRVLLFEKAIPARKPNARLTGKIK